VAKRGNPVPNNKPFEKGNQVQKLAKHSGFAPMPVYRAVQDAMDKPDLIEGEKRALIARAFQALSEGLNRRDESGQPDATTLGYTKLAMELYFGANNNPAKDAIDRGTFRIKVVYDDERPSLGLVDPDARR
jgi:hypothetical protein